MNIRCQWQIALILAAAGLHCLCEGAHAEPAEGNRIQPYADNPFYWQYKANPVLLLGGSDDDNLFQWTGSKLTDQLELLKSVGGNYVRNTMSDRKKEGPVAGVYAFKSIGGGRYDLSQWNEEYWRRLDRFLRETHRREIFVQIELWDAFDWMDQYGYLDHPWDPRNNINYTAEESGIPTSWSWSPHRKDHPLVLTVPGLANAERGKVVLRFQEKFVEKVLETCLKFDHVLFTIHNETSAPHEWSDYWASFLNRKAAARGRTVFVSDMREEDIKSRNPHQHMIARPDLYTFLEVSKTNRSHQQAHWDRILLVRSRLMESRHVRPMNNTKIMYGPPIQARTAKEKAELADKFWRDILGGTASARFHRVHNGLGLTDLAQRHINSARMFTDGMSIFSMAPSNDLFPTRRSQNEVYAMAEPGKQYALFFTGLSTADGGVDIDLSSAPGNLRARWLDIVHSRWAKEETLRGGGVVTLRKPGSGPWAVLITRSSARKHVAPPSAGHSHDRVRPEPTSLALRGPEEGC